jgi:hypothetical protein
MATGAELGPASSSRGSSGGFASPYGQGRRSTWHKPARRRARHRDLAATPPGLFPQGARFELHYEKYRGFYGEDAQPFEAQYRVDQGAELWTRTEIADADRSRVVAAIQEGMSIREAAEALGFSKSKVDRLRRKAIEAGELGSDE